MKWFRTSFETGDLGACDTFKVPGQPFADIRRPDVYIKPMPKYSKNAPGRVRDAIINALDESHSALSVAQIVASVQKQIGETPSFSIRSYLRLNTPELFIREGRGKYRAKSNKSTRQKIFSNIDPKEPAFSFQRSQLHHDDCFDWLERQPHCSIHAVVTDPPYGLHEYTDEQQLKLRAGKGGVWRIPPSYDGHKRSPLPRFTTLDENQLIRLTMTMRGGDRPKGAHDEFQEVSVMPRSMWEPWLLFRKPLERRVQDNLRKWKTGGFRRPNSDNPFGDVVASAPTRRAERELAPHPSLKPQVFLRQLVRGVLPLGESIILDPFAGAGSTLAACNTVNYESVGVEKDRHYFVVAADSIPKLTAYKGNGSVTPYISNSLSAF